MKKIKLTQDKYALVDDEDYKSLIHWKWQLDDKGYALRTLTLPNSRKTSLRMHRYICGLLNGDRRHVDHINGIILDNQKKNLRIATASQNASNSKLYKSNSSGFKGVSWNKSAKKWHAYIKHEGKLIHLGLFTSSIEAHQEYCKHAISLKGEFANFGKGSILLRKK